MQYKDYIKRGDYKRALIILARMSLSRETAYHLSLLCQHLHLFKLEKQIIAKARSKWPDWNFMIEREAWYNKPLFHLDPKQSRLVPREPLHLERNPNTTPSQEVLDQFCFVTASGSDHPYWHLTIELLESLEATQLYKDIPIYIFDVGLNSNDKEILLNRFKSIKAIKDPGWDIDPSKINIPNRPLNAVKACTARAFIPKHFPGYKYYFWMDTDTWVQDERKLDVFLQSAVTDGVGVCSDHYKKWSHNHYWYGQHKKYNKIIPEIWFHNMDGTKSTILGACCINLSSGLFEKWQENVYDSVQECGYIWGNDELTFAYAFHQLGFNNILPFHFQYDSHLEGFPKVKENILYQPSTDEIIGIMHLTGNRYMKDHSLCVCHVESGVFDDTKLAEHKELTYQVMHGTFSRNNNDDKKNLKLYSAHWRQYPGENINLQSSLETLTKWE